MYKKPFRNLNQDKNVGKAYNCIYFYAKEAVTRSWTEWNCIGWPRGCPCAYNSPPLLHLRGFCPATLVEDGRYTVTTSAADPNNIIMVGRARARIQCNSSFSQQWVYSDPRFNFTTMSRASQNSFVVLGKHNRTVPGDKYQCYEGS